MNNLNDLGLLNNLHSNKLRLKLRAFSMIYARKIDLHSNKLRLKPFQTGEYGKLPFIYIPIS